MSVLDFLFNGSPPPSTTTYGSSTANLPQWYSDYTQGLLSKGNSVAAEPFQAYSGPRVADFTPDTQNSFQMTRDNAGNWKPASEQAQGMVQQAAGMSPVGAAAPALGAAASVDPFGAASGSLGAASQTAPGAMGAYMNPYNDLVTNRIGELAGRNLSENLMPAIGDQFVRAGQFGSARMQDATGRALRDTQEGALAAQGNVLQQGFSQANSAFQSDQSRLAGIGQTQGGLAQNYMNSLANIGQTMGNLTNAGQQNTLTAGVDMSNLAGQQQQFGLRDAAAVSAIGDQQQNLAQKSLDTGYNDFLEQRQYPWTQLSNMNSLVRGMQVPTSTNTSYTGPASSYQASPLSSLVGGLSLFNALGGSK